MTGTAQQGLYFEDLSVGQEASLTSTVKDEHITSFAEISGDTNPVHLDEAFAATTPFKQRIAHGMLSAAYISAVFGTKLPGPGCIYISQTLNFKAPVHIGDEVVTTVRVTDLITEKRRAIFHCECKVSGKAVVVGEAVIMVPSREPKQK
ncbi:MaoC family dehydratase [Rhodomicrobium sp. Az07]|uniref:MaoC family dehydratase n=1 Tax=Rhodomicrobium sp. Az07 TaxID=2839034 RepID=UPI001BEAD317|nr:MaoC family dehydratase [Rhodomicrobium sp. Az07]MBT3071942.1 MaoC family dehydratase [Rhodomicrobium sp. Az07]